MPFTIYLDDSGTSPSQQVACATACIIPANRILRLESEWANLKDKEGFSDFHTSEFVARNPKSDFANWDDERLERVFRRVRQILKKYLLQVFTFSVQKKDYEQAVPAELRRHAGQFHYSWALRHVLRCLVTWKYLHQVVGPYQFVFDWMKEHSPERDEVEAVMEQAEKVAIIERGTEGDYKNYSFHQRKTIAGLQCADLLAWTNYQFALERYRNKPVHPLAKIAWDDFATMPVSPFPHFGKAEWNFSISLKLDALKDWARREIADGRSIERFERWEEERKQRKARAADDEAK